MNRYEAADAKTFLQGVEVSICKDHNGVVHYGLVVFVDDYKHGIVAQVGNKEFDRNDMLGIIQMWWHQLAADGHIGHGSPLVGWEDNLITLTGDPLMDAAQVAHAAGSKQIH